VVSADYLGDILEHPELWDRPTERVAAVRTMLEVVERQLIENTRQVNSATDLDFRVALATLETITSDDEFAELYGARPLG